MLESSCSQKDHADHVDVTVNSMMVMVIIMVAVNWDLSRPSHEMKYRHGNKFSQIAGEG